MIYADAAATTRLAPGVFKAMQPYMEDNFFNPGGVYPGAVCVRRAVNGAHSIVGEALGCQGREIFFTSGGTEADNWALKQFIAEKPAHIITSQIEHKIRFLAVLIQIFRIEIQIILIDFFNM